MRHSILLCLLLLKISGAFGQKKIILAGTIQENGQLTPITLNITIYKDSTTGTCQTIFPVNRKNSQKVWSLPTFGFERYSVGYLTLVLGNFRYIKSSPPLPGYEITDGFDLNLVRNSGKWEGRFFDNSPGKPTRQGTVTLVEVKEMPPPPVTEKKKQIPPVAVIKKKPVVKPVQVKAAPPLPDTVVKKIVRTMEPAPADTLGKYQPLYRWSQANVALAIQDAFKEDEDVIAWSMDNGAPKEITITNAPQRFPLTLSPGKVHVLTITLLKEGNERGNTPAIDLSDGTSSVHRDLSGDFGKVYKLYLLYQP